MALHFDIPCMCPYKARDRTPKCRQRKQTFGKMCGIIKCGVPVPIMQGRRTMKTWNCRLWQTASCTLWMLVMNVGFHRGNRFQKSDTRRIMLTSMRSGSNNFNFGFTAVNSNMKGRRFSCRASSPSSVSAITFSLPLPFPLGVLGVPFLFIIIWPRTRWLFVGPGPQTLLVDSIRMRTTLIL